MNILVSACLLGVNCRYNGESNYNGKIHYLLKRHVLIPVCPEQLGGMATPRPPVEIFGGDGKNALIGDAKVLSKNGDDFTNKFVNGAEETLKIAKLYRCSIAIFKAKSPSCGYKRIYDGSFSKKIIEGNGITAQLLLDNGINILTEEDDFDFI